MPKLSRAGRNRKSPADYAANYHKFYAEPWVVAALDALAALNKKEKRKHTSRSALILARAKTLLRQEAPRLRASGVTLPEALFV